MKDAAEQLPDDVDALKKLVQDQRQQITDLQEELRLALYRRFAPKSEKIPKDQLNLFDEAEVEAEKPEETEEPQEITVPEPARKKPGRKPLPEHLPRTRIEHDIRQEEKQCACGCVKSRIGEETSEQLNIIPAKVEVLQHVRFKYACKACEGVEDEGKTVTIAPAPPQPIPKSMASPGLLAYVVIAKFLDGLPLYRQEKMFSRIGVELGRGTMARWMIAIGDLILPLINLLNEVQLDYDILQMDETTVQVLKEPDRDPTSKSYMWVRRGGPPDRPVILFDYEPTRAGSIPVKLLADYKGVLQTDDYGGYNGVAKRDEIIHVACLAHVRRYFVNAINAQGKDRKKKSKNKKGGLANQGLDFIGRIYGVERKAREHSLDAEARKQLRLQHAKPVWDELRIWLDKYRNQVPPSSKTGQALNYLDKQWTRLTRVLDDGRIEVDNNLCENAIRPFVLGRKAWLFSDTVNGAKASANLYSLIETAKANNLEPYTYLKHIFTELPKATTADNIEALLPYNARQSLAG